eukprot:1189825-Prorocentrum_minimum.AAC.10
MLRPLVTFPAVNTPDVQHKTCVPTNRFGKGRMLKISRSGENIVRDDKLNISPFHSGSMIGSRLQRTCELLSVMTASSASAGVGEVGS